MKLDSKSRLEPEGEVEFEGGMDWMSHPRLQAMPSATCGRWAAIQSICLYLSVWGFLVRRSESAHSPKPFDQMNGGQEPKAGWSGNRRGGSSEYKHLLLLAPASPASMQDRMAWRLPSPAGYVRRLIRGFSRESTS